MIGRLRMLGAAAIVVGAILAGLWWVSPRVEAQAPPPGRVGFVDLQRILAKSQAGVLAREQLEKDKAGMQKQVDNQKGDLDKLRDELEKKGQLLSVEARRDKQEQLERKVRDVRRLVDDLEKELIQKALDRTSWNQSKAARLLGLTRRTLQYRVEKYNIRRPGEPAPAPSPIPPGTGNGEGEADEDDPG